MSARSPFLHVAKTERTGLGVFTSRAFRAGERVAFLAGPTRRNLPRTPEGAALHPNWIGIGLNAWVDPAPPFDHLNHSCEPNLGVRGARVFVALRAIEAGEELTIDYAITEDEPYWQMQCLCGRPACRGVIRPVQFLPEATFQAYLPNIGDYFQGFRRGYLEGVRAAGRATEAA